MGFVQNGPVRGHIGPISNLEIYHQRLVDMTKRGAKQGVRPG